MLIKVSDYIASFLKSKNLKNIFAVSGGASLHLIDSVAVLKGIKYYCPIHEQSCAMAADSYSRVSASTGVVFTSSGPGATNLATGICGAYFDSIPVLFITGQVSTTRSKENLKVRQIGFQETDCVSMYKSVTKYICKIKKSEDIVYELEKAYFIANYHRPGPVLIDIPDNIQREIINTKKVKKFNVNSFKKTKITIQSLQINKIIECISNSKRPVLILGWGIHLSNAYYEAKKLFKKLGFPTALTWAMAHLLEYKEPMNLGTWGTHGTRFANFAVQNADLIISIGSRLDTKATGSPINTFARAAKKIVIDIDQNELNKFHNFDMSIDIKVNSDAKAFINALIKRISKRNYLKINDWLSQINIWKKQYPICPESYYLEKKINPYVFVKKLSEELSENEIICADTGCTIAWMMQAFEFKKNQKLFHDFNNTAMGWALPASIGASLAMKNKRIICVVGDGSFSFNIQELATIQNYNLPIKIFLLNNKGYSMIRQTQDQWLKSKYYASSYKGGLAIINYLKIAKSYGFNTLSVNFNKELTKAIKKTINNNNNTLCEIVISPNKRVIPQAKFGRPNEDLEPLLPRKEFKKNMLIKIR